MGLENTSWTWFRDSTKPIEGLKLQRIENRVSSGFPDVIGHYVETSFFIENKACDRPVRPTSLLRFEIYKEQIIWLREWWQAGAVCFALVRIGREREARVYLIPGDMGKFLKKCHEHELAEMSVLPNSRASAQTVLDCVVNYRKEW